ncbi:Lrp/AsnC family transcriptional regulator [Pseudohalocynthiibacter aestuariivivens]|uniref:Lrp/AsnC family transcriptional regulator n=1 Tax=Pseudohalocynthiibacter aestuariivivens TaxID=1591409 RepID=A0ABV5JJ91_9RHOB|nr:MULTISPECIES: Lrp/AsnC family transcriptional regulator [Pseudohalocynthiibacter]MBS9716115.1 Lrp/AsnC family transcriptional regulator [Pseudohalocynthiibacter aestuariivivens]MCK0101077.1 Lrp/AsnC family transcriptional regulator [Pseudohalocynthiibacter sp. F2068]
MAIIDETDRKILKELQRDASLGLESLGEKVHLSRNACWRRIKALEDSGVIRGRVALLEPGKVGLGLTVFMFIRTSSHDANWLTKFARATSDMPEVLSAYRMTGDLDYLIRARVSDVAGYDQLYQRLINKIDMSDVSASFVMEELKETTELPL